MTETQQLSLSEKLEALRRPFHPDLISFKPGAVSGAGNKAIGLAFADLRCYMQRLDDVFDADWNVSYSPWGDNKIICEVSLQVIDSEGFHTTTRQSIGEGDGENGGTSAEAQSFKRACAMFGLGRYLYDLPQVWAECKVPNPSRPKNVVFTPAGLAQLKASVVERYNAETGSNVPMPAAPVPSAYPGVPAAPPAPLPAWDQSDGGGPRFTGMPDWPPVEPEELFYTADSSAQAGPSAEKVNAFQMWVRQQNAVPGDIASEKQQTFLISRLAWVCGKGSNGARALDMLLGGPVPVKKALASQLIDMINEHNWDPATKSESPNPKYDANAAAAVREMYNGS